MTAAGGSSQLMRCGRAADCGILLLCYFFYVSSAALSFLEYSATVSSAAISYSSASVAVISFAAVSLIAT